MITDAYRYVPNKEMHDVVHNIWFSEVICDNFTKQEQRLTKHINIEAIQILSNTQELRRLNGTKPYKLCECIKSVFECCILRDLVHWDSLSILVLFVV